MNGKPESDCRKEWVGKDIFTYCPVHNEYFKKTCKFLKEEIVLNPKKESLVSVPYDSNVLTPKQQEALKLYNDGNSYQFIADCLKIKKGTAQDLINRAIKKARSCSLTIKRTPLTIAQSIPLTIRLHNDEFKCKINCNYSLIKGELKNKDRNLEYKLIKSDILFIKVHKNSTLTVRFLTDIECDNESDCKIRADKRLEDWLKSFNIDGINFILNSKLINRHYGLLGSSFAKKVTDDRKIFIVRDFDGSVRLRIDLSQGAEIDSEHVEKGLVDMKETREYFDSLINNPHYKPDEVKVKLDDVDSKINRFLDILDKTNSALDKNTNANIWMTENIESHREVLKDMKDTLMQIKDNSSKNVDLPPISTENLHNSRLNLENNDFNLNTISKYDTKKDVIRKWSLNFK